MAYIGRDTDKISNVEVLDNITFDGSSSYTLQKGGSNFTPSSANTLLVSIDGVVQAGNFTVSGSTIDFGTAVAGTSTCDFILHYGIGLITSVSDGTVTSAKIGANAVTGAKLNNDVISAQTALTSEPADTDEFLVSDAGTLKRIDYSLIKGGGVTEIDRWLMADQTLADAATLGNWSRHNTSITGVPHGTGMSASSGIWTFPSTGVYEITFMTYIWNGTSGTRQFIGIDIKGTNDAFSSNTQSIGTSYSNVITDNAHNNLNVNGIYDVTNTSNNKLKFVTTGQGTCGFYTTIATFKKLMET